MKSDAQPANRTPTKQSLDAGVIMESRGLKKTYGSGPQNVPVLIDANLILRKGEMVAVVAPSGAEQQRVALARSLVTGPSVLLADQPTGDLDEQNAWAMFALLERLHRVLQLTSLIATHNLALAARCDRILGLEHGVLRSREAAAIAGWFPG